MTNLDLGVIVPCHNEESTLPQQLDALVAQTWSGSWEILVVDNNSTDATAAITESYASRAVSVRLVTATDGRGVAYARNAGAAATDARSVAFCDGDDMVLPGWVAAMGDALRDDDLVAGTLDVDLLNEEWLALTRPMGANDDLPRFGATPFARGNNCGMRRQVWAELGGFREDFVGLEDIEFSLRAAARGHEPTLVPGARVAYRFRADLRSVWRQGFFYGRGRPALASQAAAAGLAPPGRFDGLRSWAWLAVHLPGLVTRTGRHAWLWTLANRIGVLRGAIESRRLFV